ncbi:MAG TPA: STAS domain-containing protein [Terriglobales bacterium]|nr:STAS domain-containing protein [Terriglobales bacterium]
MPRIMKSEPLIIRSLPVTPPGQGVLCLEGPLTMDNVSQFQSAIRREEAAKMILDLTQVPYIDSAGLGSIVSAHVSLQKAGRWMALVGVNERVSRLFEITHVQDLFLTFPNIWDAIEALTKAADA